MINYLDDNDYLSKYTSIKRRVFAIIFDYALLFFINFIAIANGIGEKHISETIVETSLTIPTIFFITTWIIVIPSVESYRGQTLGKFIFKAIVLKADFTKISFIDSLFRHCFDVIDMLPLFGILGILIASKNKRNQRLGDLVANTIVVRRG